MPLQNLQAAAITAGATGDWSSTGTWTGGVVPVSGDTVTIGNTYTVSVASGNATSSAVTVSAGGNLTLSGGNLTLATGTALANNGSVLISSGTLTLNAVANFVTGSGTFNLTGGNFTYLRSGATNAAQGNNFIVSGGSLYWATRFIGSASATMPTITVNGTAASLYVERWITSTSTRHANINYIFDASGVSQISTAGFSSIDYANITANGTSYTGGAGNFTLMTGVSTGTVFYTPTASNFTGYNATFGLSGTNYRLTLTSYSTIWDGGGADTNINTAGNWADDLSPNLTNGHNIFTFGTGGSTATINTNLNAKGLILDRASDFTIASGAGSLTVGGNGVISSGANHTIAEAVILGSNQTWDVTDSLTVSAAVSGGYNLTKNGAGTLTLSATNTYNGSTTLNAGTLAVSGDIANSGLVINSGGIISPGTSAAADSFGTSSITINGGGYNWTLSSANGSAGTGYDQITSTGALTSSGLLTVNIYGTPGDWDGSANYSWDIFSANSVTGFSTGNFAYDLTNFNSGVTPAGTFTFSNPSGGIIRLSYTAPSDPVWAGGTGNWTTGFTTAPTDGANIAFAGATGGTATNNIPTGTLTAVGDIEFRSSAGAYTLAADAGSAGASGGTALTVNGSITNNSTATQTLNTDLAFAATRTIAANTGNITIGGAISGAGGLTKNGSNKLTLTAANTYTGDTTINTGTLEIGSGSTTGSLSSSSAITNNANLVFNRSNDLTVSNTIGGTGNLTKNGAGTLTLSGNSTYSGTTTISDGALRATHANALGSTAAGTTVTSGAALELSGGISIGAEALSLSGTGISSGGALRNISGDNSYAGAITLAAATLINSDSGNLTLSGIMSGSSSLTKNGSGRLTLSATNTYTGGTTINGGTLAITDGAITTIGNGTITINNGSTLSLTRPDFRNQSIIFGSSGGGNLTTSTGSMDLFGTTISTTGGATNFISGQSFDAATPTFNVADGTDDVDLQVSNLLNRQGVTKSGAGKLLLTNASNNPQANTITINAGALEIGATGRLLSGAGSWTGNMTNNGIFIYSGTSAQTISGIISGSGALTQNASSTLTLSGNNTYSGATTINAGTIQISAAGRLGAGSYAQNITNNGTLIYSGTNAQTLSGIISGTGNLTKNAASTLTLTGANTYSGATTINTGTLQIGNGLTTGSLNATSAITVNGTLAFNRSDSITQGTHFSTAAIGGTGSIVQNGAGTLTLNAANTYSGGTTLNTGTLVIGNAAAAGNGTITQASGSLLKFDTTGTITNAMSVYNVLASQSATLSGAITVNNAVFDVATGETLTISNTINGTGGVTKNGTGTLVLSGSNSYSAPTVINAGTLNATTANALGSNNTVTVNGGSLLVSTDDAINGKNIELGGSGIGLQFSGNYSGAIGNLTLSANSIIDLGAGSVQIRFQGLTNSSNHTLSFYNWSGTTLWNGGNGTTDTDKVYFGPDLSDEALAKIYFYTGPGDSFLGSGFDLGLKATGFDPPWNQGYQIIPVPEPETYATGLLLLLGGGLWMFKRNRNTCQRALAGQPAEGSPKGETSGSERGNA